MLHSQKLETRSGLIVYQEDQTEGISQRREGHSAGPDLFFPALGALMGFPGPLLLFRCIRLIYSSSNQKEKNMFGLAPLK